MRAIKFRAKVFQNPKKTYLGNYKNGEWVYGDLHLLSPNPHIHPDIGKIAPIDKETVGQFTGLLDKNSKEIYEGDFLCGKGGIFRIIWFEPMLRFAAVCRNCIWYNLEEKNASSWEVIGNIYDNPELLKLE